MAADLEGLRAELLNFLEGEESVATGRLSTGTVDILHAVQRLLGAEPEALIAAKRISFGGADSLDYPVSVDEIEAGINSRTLILQGLELSEDALGEMCRDISEETGRPVGASSYLSVQASEAFDWHIDRWDAMVMQLDGSKVFEFKENASVALEPGDVLMFRQGVEHRTRTVGHSVHVSVSVRD